MTSRKKQHVDPDYEAQCEVAEMITDDLPDGAALAMMEEMDVDPWDVGDDVDEDTYFPDVF